MLLVGVGAAGGDRVSGVIGDGGVIGDDGVDSVGGVSGGVGVVLSSNTFLAAIDFRFASSSFTATTRRLTRVNSGVATIYDITARFQSGQSLSYLREVCSTVSVN